MTTSKPTIILVHGAWHGPWCWTDVAVELRSIGWTVEAITLPGHDHPGDGRRIWDRVSAYVDEVRRAAEAAGQPPVLVGHSMGGYVIQRYLEHHQAVRGVLVASVPLRGVVGANLRMLRQTPAGALKAALTADYLQLVPTVDEARHLFLRAETENEVAAKLFGQLQNESALAINTMLTRWPRPSKVSTPMSVIAAADDAIFTLDEQRDLAKAYGAELRVISDSGHDIMLDANWRELVAAIDEAANS